jgi:uncharacterized coiled-coil protein SlyX
MSEYVVGTHGALQIILRKLDELREQNMATQEAIDELRAAVAEQTTVIGSNTVMLDRLLTMFEAAADDPEEIRAIVADVRAGASNLSADVARGTAAADEAEGGMP